MPNKPKSKAGAPKGRRPAFEDADNPVDGAMEALAARLLHHFELLTVTKDSRPREWPDEAKIRQRAAGLVRACHRLWHVPGPNLAALIERLLSGAKIPSTAVTKRTLREWSRAVRAEAMLVEAGSKVTVRSVAAAAFGKDRADARSKDVRDWRRTPEYQDALLVARLMLRVHGSIPENEIFRSFTPSPTAMAEGLAPLPPGKSGKFPH